jgi:transcriptional regulator with XRE-family HTH domain
VTKGTGPAARTDPAFRHWLRELRDRAGLTQEQLAQSVGTDRRNIRRWEVEGHDPAGSVLLRILDAVGVRLVPAPPRGAPRALNAELRDLQAVLREAEDRAERRHEELLAQLAERSSAARARRVASTPTPE